MAHPDFDIAILGAGCASLQLLHQLSLQKGWSSTRVGLFHDATIAPRSWCFWSTAQHPLQHLVKKSWHDLRFVGHGFEKAESIAPYSYHYIAGEDFYQYFYQDFLPKQKNIAVIPMKVDSVTQQKTGFHVNGGGRCWSAQQVFSSIFSKPEKTGRFWLQQHFKGWFIKTNQPVFDDTCATLMDFSIAQKADTRFIYILPFSDREALVEMTVFSPNTYEPAAYEQVLHQYMEQHFPNTQFTIENTEFGIIPMTDAGFQRYGLAGEVLLGTAAGMVKASTGFAFQRISHDVARLAEDQQQARDFRWSGTTGRFKFYDRLLLGILQEQPQFGRRIFETLFKKMDIKTILRFLDEDTRLRDEVRIFSQLPFKPFINQVYQQWIH